MHLHLGRVVLVLVTLRQRRNPLDFLQRAGISVIGKGGYGVAHFTDDVGKVAIGAEGEVPRPGAVGQGDRRGIVGR